MFFLCFLACIEAASSVEVSANPADLADLETPLKICAASATVTITGNVVATPSTGTEEEVVVGGFLPGEDLSQEEAALKVEEEALDQEVEDLDQEVAPLEERLLTGGLTPEEEEELAVLLRELVDLNRRRLDLDERWLDLSTRGCQVWTRGGWIWTEGRSTLTEKVAGAERGASGARTEGPGGDPDPRRGGSDD